MLTAIVISFATTALLLVVLLAARGLTGTDHVDGQEPDAMSWARTCRSAHRAAARCRRADAAARRAARAAQGGDQPGRARLAARRGARPAARSPTRPLAPVYALGSWPAPFGIVLVADRLAAPWCCSRAARPRRLGVLAGALAPRRAALSRPASVPADGPERRVPHRRPVQPVRVLRAAARRVLRPRAARLRQPRVCARACTTSSSTSRPRCCS